MRPENYKGAGAYGFVVGVLANEKPCAVKVEISRRSNGLSALEREVCTFRINNQQPGSSFVTLQVAREPRRSSTSGKSCGLK